MRVTTLVALSVMAATLATSTAAVAQNSFGSPSGQPQPYPPQQNFPGPQNSAPQNYPAPQQNYPAPQQNYPTPQNYPAPQNYPSQGPMPSGGGGGGWNSASPNGNPPGSPQGSINLDQLMQMERQDFGVPPTAQLHNGAMHGPTPASIAGGQVVTTKGLLGLLGNNQAQYAVFDVLGGAEAIPGALSLVWASQPGSFDDPIQQQLGQFLQQGTRGRKEFVLVFYCLSNQCWLSYNAALRAINLGYKNVLWYRGGIEAWKMAGQPTQPSSQGQQSPQQSMRQ